MTSARPEDVETARLLGEELEEYRADLVRNRVTLHEVFAARDATGPAIVVVVSHERVEGVREIWLSADGPATGWYDLWISVWQWLSGEWQAERFERLPLHQPSPGPAES